MVMKLQEGIMKLVEVLEVLTHLVGWELSSGRQVAGLWLWLKLQLLRLPHCCPWVLLWQMLEGLIRGWVAGSGWLCCVGRWVMLG